MGRTPGELAKWTRCAYLLKQARSSRRRSTACALPKESTVTLQTIKAAPKALAQAAWGMSSMAPLQEYAFGELPYRLIKNGHPFSTRIGVPRGWFCTYPTTVANAMGQPIMGMGFPLIDADDREVNFLMMGPPWALEDRLFTGLPIAGCSVALGKLTPKVLVTVDPIDAMALNAATGLHTVAVLYAENIADVCRTLKLRFPDVEIQVCLLGDGGTKAEHSQSLRLLRGVSKKIVGSVSFSGESSFSKIYAASGQAGVQAVLAVCSTRSAWDVDQKLKKLRISEAPMLWPHRVNGAGLMTNLVAALQRYIELPDDDAWLIALWIVHTHAMSTSRFSPLLVIVSPEYGCGKSALLALLQRLCFKALRTGKVTFAQALKLTRDHQPTLILDEAKALLESASFIPFFIAGHDRKSAGIIADHKKSLEVAETFVPKAVGLVGEPPEALLERSVRIALQRLVEDKPAVPVPDKAERLNDDMTALSAQIGRWVFDHLLDLKAVPIKRLPFGSPRVSDTFSPLLAIARVAGPEIEARAMQAVRQSVACNEVKSSGMLLLENLKEVLATTLTGTFLKTSDLLSALNAEGKEDWGWTTYNRGKPLDALYLSKLLRPYNVIPGKSGGGTDRGYRRADLEDAIRRYVSSVGRQAAQ